MNQLLISCCINAGVTPKLLESELKKVQSQVRSKQLPQEEETDMMRETFEEKMSYLADRFDLDIKDIKKLRHRWNICLRYEMV